MGREGADAQPCLDYPEDLIGSFSAAAALLGMSEFELDCGIRLVLAVEASGDSRVMADRAGIEQLLAWVAKTARDRQREIPTARTDEATYLAALGPRLRAVRRYRRLSIEQLANATNLTRSQLTDYESGALVPDIAAVRRIAVATAVPIGSPLADPRPEPPPPAVSAIGGQPVPAPPRCGRSVTDE
jgi:DNA-binding transcriptional regulator YiaG